MFAYEGRFSSVQLSPLHNLSLSSMSHIFLFSSVLLYSMAHLLPFSVLLVCHICVSSLSLSLLLSYCTVWPPVLSSVVVFQCNGLCCVSVPCVSCLGLLYGPVDAVQQ